jgi:hypothetical protein
MPYNLTNLTDANNIYAQVKAVNDLSGSMLFSLILLATFFIFLVVFKRRDIKQVLLADWFLIIVLAVMGWALDLIGWMYIVVPVIGMIGSLVAFMIMD